MENTKGSNSESTKAKSQKENEARFTIGGESRIGMMSSKGLKNSIPPIPESYRTENSETDTSTTVAITTSTLSMVVSQTTLSHRILSSEIPRNTAILGKSSVKQADEFTKNSDLFGENGDVQTFANVLSDSVSNTLEKLKKMLGLTPECLNGGTKTLQGDCRCPKYYAGDLCQDIVCINNGTRVIVSNTLPTQYACRCVHPEYISGAHCELIKCMNGGQPLSNGHCRCLDYWYSGQFCENYTASWGAVLGVPLLCIAIMFICCIVCRLDWCPRKRISQQRRRWRPPASNSVPAASASHRHHSLGIEGSAPLRCGNNSPHRMQETLMNEGHLHSVTFNPTAPPLLQTPRNVRRHIRLDTIPVFNPQMTGGVCEADIKLIDPPPSYEEVISSNSMQQRYSKPPEYTCQSSHSLPHDLSYGELI
ncbi:hypothetical protein AB6A40_004120 [Gnathostoma spinigerum]|uniref:EGF-like domain-containing protein n=1 Tax=Gnathostoma spinigerum TaxID=75299 RepID=A0ABD6EJ32_9BILA